MQKLRRQILKAAIVLPLAAAFGPRLATLAASGANADEWVQTGTDLQQGTLDGVRFDGKMIVAGSGGGTYTSPVHMTPGTFQSVAGTWKASSGAAVDVRAGAAADSGWSDWVALPVGDESLENKNPGITASSVATVPTGHYLQYRVRLQAGSQLQEMRLVAMDTSEGPPPGTGITIQSAGAPKIISRAGWGANERYRYTDSGELIWPPEYQKPYKIILHHTVTPNMEANPAATVRSVFYYHAVTLGWGDIGYNFLIDWKGNIYEGRAGGANVVGGHALKYNYGSIGIAVLGTYHTTPITNDSYNALVKLVAWKIDALNIDPLGTGWFIDHTTYNICAHRDAMVGQTTCNGDAFHAQLPAIRKSVQALVSASSNRAPTWASWAFDGSTRTASLIVKDPDSGVSTSSTEFQLQENGTWGGWRKVPGKRGDNNTMTLIVPYIRATANAIQFRATDTAGAQSTSPVYSFPAGVNVDNRFEHYFLVHDGMRTLGKPLTPLLVKDGIALQYFEKGRLEDHSKETSNPDWQIQYGLLVDELHNAKANLPIGGDTSSLTYAGLHDIADPARRVQPPPGYKGYGVYTVAPDGTTFVPFTADLRGAPGHMILGGFWNFINRADLFSGGWFHDLGLPISDPIPATVTKNFPGGPAKRNIMVQAFQRAILTYDPANPADWQIERANVGTDYLKVFS